MKTIFTLTIASLLLSSCTVFYGDKPTGSDGRFYAGTVLGSFKDLDLTASGVKASSVDHDKANETIRSGITVAGTTSVTRILTKGTTEVTRLGEVTKRTGIKEKGLTDRAEIGASVEKTRILNPVEE